MASSSATHLRTIFRAVLPCRPGLELTAGQYWEGLGFHSPTRLCQSCLKFQPKRWRLYTLDPCKTQTLQGRDHKSCKPLCKLIRFTPFHPAGWEGWGGVENASVELWVWRAPWEHLRVGPLWLTPLRLPAMPMGTGVEGKAVLLIAFVRAASSSSKSTVTSK